MVQLASQFIEALVRSRLLPPARQAEIDARIDSAGGAEAMPPNELAEQLVSDGLITRFQAEKLLDGKFRELNVGPYVLTDLIGIGGMGAVYAAVDPETRHPVAVKVLSQDFKYDVGMRTRFRLEARSGMAVDHPNLVRTLAHGTTDDVFGDMDYVVMEHFRGIALHELLSVHGPLSWSMAADVISQAAAALQYLHERGLIHRDVKPDNLLIDESGQVKLIDYGLALTSDAVRDGKVLEAGEEFTLTMLFGHDCLGTPDYMAPEQSANSLAADARSDIYALGCTFYTVLAARRPYQAGSKSALLEAHRSGEIPHITALNPAVPGELDAIITRMMAKDPSQRFDSMAQLIASLEPFSRRRPVRFQYAELLRARRRLAEKKSGLSRKSNPSRSTSGYRAALLAAHLETGVSTETAVDEASAARKARTPPPPAQSAAELAQQAFAAYQAPPEASAPVLAALRFPDGMEVPIRGMNFRIGRAPSNDFVLSVADLSAVHCSFTFDGDRWILRDHDSRNGVRVNGRRIKEVVVDSGDLVTLATNTHFRFTTPSARRRPRWVTAMIAAALAAGLGGLGWWAWIVLTAS